MKKILITLSGIALALVAVVGALVGYAVYAGSKSDVSSKAYVDRVVPTIVGTWSAANLKREASVELRQHASDDQIAAAFQKFSTLGRIVAYGGSKGESRISFSPRTGKVVTAKYEASVTFEHGDALIDVGLVKRDDRWQIVGFFIKPDQRLR